MLLVIYYCTIINTSIILQFAWGLKAQLACDICSNPASLIKDLRENLMQLRTCEWHVTNACKSECPCVKAVSLSTMLAEHSICSTTAARFV